MPGKTLIITLLSDLCVSDGGVYNSAIDIDVCHDSAGIPFIPAKRIRGSLRECAFELKEMGADVDEVALFGTEGEQVSRVRISDAFPENMAFIREELKKNRGIPSAIRRLY